MAAIWIRREGRAQQPVSVKDAIPTAGQLGSERGKVVNAEGLVHVAGEVFEERQRHDGLRDTDKLVFGQLLNRVDAKRPFQ